MYIPIKAKFILTASIAALWMVASIYLATPWFSDLSDVVGPWLAGYLIGFIAIIPGFMNAFVLIALIFDHRPAHKKTYTYPPITILVAAYNEQDCIEETLRSIYAQDYPGSMDIVVINDGSHDDTDASIRSLNGKIKQIHLITLETNQGKSAALNIGLKHTTTDLLISVDLHLKLTHFG